MSVILTPKNKQDVDNAVGGQVKDNWPIVYLEDFTPEELLRKWNLSEMELAARGIIKPGRPISCSGDPSCDTRIYAFVETTIERYVASQERLKGMPVRDMARHWVDDSSKPVKFCEFPSEMKGFDLALRYLGMTRERFINRCIAGFMDFLADEMMKKETL